MTPTPAVLVATGEIVFRLDGDLHPVRGLDDRLPTCLAPDRHLLHGAWMGSRGDGVLRSDDGGSSWRPSGLPGEHVTAVAAGPLEGLVWAGTEPSAVWRSDDGGESWRRMEGLLELPSSSGWAFPPRPETHHVRWIACRPDDSARLWVAIEAGALVTTPDGGQTWKDRAPGGPRDTHELAVHSQRPGTLRVAAGDGYFESVDGGATWTRPREGLEVGYLRSVAVDPGDPETVLVSASSRAKTAYAAGHSDGRLYRREGSGAWERVLQGWPDPPGTIAPLLVSGTAPGELWAADERGVHRSDDAGRSWERVAAFRDTPHNLRGLAVLYDQSSQLR